MNEDTLQRVLDDVRKFEPMSSFEPMSRSWNGTRAVLFVHGVGNAEEGNYADLVDTVRDSLGDRADEVAFYELYYDVFNDWAAAKFDLAELLGNVVSLFRNKASNDQVNDKLAAQIAETAGDVLLPAFSQSARLAVRDAYVAQLLQMIMEGRAAGVQPQDQKLSIICHSLGCFHTFETLHAVVRNRNYQLHPTLNMTKFQNVIFMASPVQLIRTAFGAVDAAIKGDLAVLDNSLTQPGDPDEFEGSVSNWVSITGDLDPIGGHFLKQKANWAYMDVEEVTWRGPWTTTTCSAIVDKQKLGADDKDEDALQQVLEAAMSTDDAPPSIPLENPHSWDGYVKRHIEEISKWLLA